MPNYASSLQCACSSIGAYSLDEEHRVLGSFYRDGFDRVATHIVAAENREEYLKRLTNVGIDVQRMMQTGQLEVLP